MLREKAESKFESDVKSLKSRNMDDVAFSLNSILQTLFDQQTKSFAKLSKGLLIEGSGWADRVNAHSVDLKNHLTTLIQNCKSQILAKFREETQKTHEQKLKDMIHDSANNVEEGFAANLQEGYCENT